MYLHKDSNHPNHTKQKIAYGLALRAKRICSTQEDYEKSKADISERLQKRGHTEQDITFQLNLADEKSR